MVSGRYDGDQIPSEWEGTWQEFKSRWYIGPDSAVYLGRGPDELVTLTKDLFNKEDWAKLQDASSGRLTDEQKEILFSGITQRFGETGFGENWAEAQAQWANAAGGAIQAKASVVEASSQKGFQSSINFAKKVGLNPNSPTTKQLLSNLDITCEHFISTFRQGRIKAEFPSEFLKKTVK